VSVFDDDAAVLHSTNAPGGIAKKHDVAGEAFHGEILIDRADDVALRFRNNGIESIVGNSTAAGDGGKTSTAATIKAAIHAIVQEVGAIAPTSGVDAFREHFDDGIEFDAGQIAVGIGAADGGEQVVDSPLLAGAHGDDLLRQDVQRGLGDLDAVEMPVAHSVDERAAFHQFIAGGGKDAAFRNRSVPVTRAANALPGNGDRSSGADLTDQIDGANIDTKFKGCSGDERLDFTGLQFLFSGKS